MEEFLVKHPAVGYILITGLLAIIWWLIRMAIQNNLEKIKQHDERMDGIEYNYKDEFKKIRVDNNEKHLEILGILTEVRIEIAELKGNNHKQ